MKKPKVNKSPAKQIIKIYHNMLLKNYSEKGVERMIELAESVHSMDKEKQIELLKVLKSTKYYL